jgi:hypothetical protein
MALRQFYAAYTLKDDAPASINTLVDLQRLRTARNMFPSCQEAGFLSGFEVGIYTSVGANEMRARLGRALRAAQITAPQGLNTPPAVGKAIDQPVRDAIALLRTSYALAGQPEFDLAFYNRMMMSLVR